MTWNFDVPLRCERHFGDRVVDCFAARPPTAWSAFAAATLARPDALAVVDGERRVSYAGLAAESARGAAALAKRGVRAGDRVGLLLSNRLEFVTVLLAVLRLGAVVVPMGTRLQRPEVAYILGHCTARAVVFDAELVDRLPSATETPELTARCPIAADGSGLSDNAAEAPAPHARGEDEVAAILYTSGTTGKPKGAMLAELNLVHSMLNYRHAMRMGHDDRTLLAVPASHVTGLVANVMLAWMAQCALVIAGDFKASAFLALAARERATHTVIVPAMYKLCLLDPAFASHDLSAWRVGGYGGAPMAEATVAELAERLPGLELYNIYGSTETSGPVTMLAPRFAASRPDSTGHALPGADIVVVDDEGRPVPAGEPGELCIGGAMVVAGYWNNAEATADGFVAGRWKSGDLGSIDANGFVRVLDRKKDMLNRGGYKIYSVEVENVLLEHPAVAESAIVGKPCPVLGERVHAFVRLRDGVEAEAAALRAFCTERLADYKVPESFSLGREPLPRNANGKLLKREMRDRIAA